MESDCSSKEYKNWLQLSVKCRLSFRRYEGRAGSKFCQLLASVVEAPAHQRQVGARASAMEVDALKLTSEIEDIRRHATWRPWRRWRLGLRSLWQDFSMFDQGGSPATRGSGFPRELTLGLGYRHVEGSLGCSHILSGPPGAIQGHACRHTDETHEISGRKGLGPSYRQLCFAP